MNVLVVEDDDSSAEPIAGIIKAWDHKVEVSGTGKDALEKARRKHFDLVLLDIFLPDCKGHDLIPQLRDIHLARHGDRDHDRLQFTGAGFGSKATTDTLLHDKTF